MSSGPRERRKRCCRRGGGDAPRAGRGRENDRSLSIGATSDRLQGVGAGAEWRNRHRVPEYSQGRGMWGRFSCMAVGEFERGRKILLADGYQRRLAAGDFFCPYYIYIHLHEGEGSTRGIIDPPAGGSVPGA